MNKSAFLELIQKASSITDQQTAELEKVAQAFPYCQTAHLLLAKSAYDKGSMLSTQRLRRAAAYATDRQLLKRVIYTSPEVNPQFDQAAVADQTTSTEKTAEEKSLVVDSPANVTTTVVEDEAAAETIVSIVSEPVAEAFTETAESDAELAEEEVEQLADKALLAVTSQTETEFVSLDYTSESELASLLTINSLTSSFTDLLVQAPDIEEFAEEKKDEEETSYLLEPENALEEVKQEETDSTEVEPETLASTLTEKEDLSEAIVVEADKAVVLTESHPEDAEVTYNFSELDRMYAEDALGYWMGSSRMGEVLQLKNDYTRPKPFAFHPEMILEYNKTHELEKAIQPASNLLSEQLDIIDQFLKLNPKLKTMANLKLKPEPQEDLSIKSSKIKKGMASESLANIFLKQGKVKKAIKIYELLLLKYPEKKSYFAEQIEKLQNIN